jgi:hypothetical protein
MSLASVSYFVEGRNELPSVRSATPTHMKPYGRTTKPRTAHGDVLLDPATREDVRHKSNDIGNCLAPITVLLPTCPL